MLDAIDDDHPFGLVDLVDDAIDAAPGAATACRTHRRANWQDASGTSERCSPHSTHQMNFVSAGDRSMDSSEAPRNLRWPSALPSQSRITIRTPWVARSGHQTAGALRQLDDRNGIVIRTFLPSDVPRQRRRCTGDLCLPDQFVQSSVCSRVLRCRSAEFEAFHMLSGELGDQLEVLVDMEHSQVGEFCSRCNQQVGN